MKYILFFISLLLLASSFDASRMLRASSTSCAIDLVYTYSPSFATPVYTSNINNYYNPVVPTVIDTPNEKPVVSGTAVTNVSPSVSSVAPLAQGIVTVSPLIEMNPYPYVVYVARKGSKTYRVSVIHDNNLGDYKVKGELFHKDEKTKENWFNLDKKEKVTEDFKEAISSCRSMHHDAKGRKFKDFANRVSKKIPESLVDKNDYKPAKIEKTEEENKAEAAAAKKKVEDKKEQKKVEPSKKVEDKKQVKKEEKKNDAKRVETKSENKKSENKKAEDKKIEDKTEMTPEKKAEALKVAKLMSGDKTEDKTEMTPEKKAEALRVAKLMSGVSRKAITETKKAEAKVENTKEEPTKKAEAKVENTKEESTKKAEAKVENTKKEPTKKAEAKVENTKEEPTKKAEQKKIEVDTKATIKKIDNKKPEAKLETGKTA